MAYINKTTLQYPVSEQDIRSEFPNTSFPALFVPPEEYAVVFDGPKPAYNPLTQTVREAAPALSVKGNYEQQWEVVNIYTTQSEEDAVLAEALATRKAAKNTQINLWRAEANQSTFPYQGKLIACDQLSRSDIDGVANSISLNGSFPTGFPNAWRCTDNSYIPLKTVAAFKAMYSAMTAQGSDNFAKAQALKTALAAATAQSEVDAIAW